MKCWNVRCSNRDLSPQAITCPECHTDRPKEHAQAGSAEDAWARDQIARMRQSLACGHAGPSSFDLTEQQWINVCILFPNVAKRAKRTIPDLTGKRAVVGPLMTTLAVLTQREPGCDDEPSADRAAP